LDKLLLLDLIGGIGMTTTEFRLLRGSFGAWSSGVMEVTNSVLSLVMTNVSAMLLMLVLIVNAAALALRIALLMVERRSF
jgi:hypothetical protein